MLIRDSAYRHGETTEDILHVVRNPVFIHYLDGYRMIVGATPDGRLLEVAIRDTVIFHAMPARPKFLRRK